MKLKTKPPAEEVMSWIRAFRLRNPESEAQVSDLAQAYYAGHEAGKQRVRPRRIRTPDASFAWPHRCR